MNNNAKTSFGLAVFLCFFNSVVAHSAPERLENLGGATRWLNSAPLTKADLAGKVVALDFYTSACGNCQAAVPHVVALSNKYRQRGLIVIGIHTPEQSFEKNTELVVRGAAKLGINYPIAINNNNSIWNLYDNHYWPNLLIYDRRGNLAYQHAGEGNYDEIDTVCARLLKN